MANILYDEKRVPYIGEVCAIQLKYIQPVCLAYDFVRSDEDLGENFYSFFGKNKSIDSSDDITFIKYLGNGFFMDLVSEQLFMTSMYNEDDFGNSVLRATDEKNRDELTKICDFWVEISLPNNFDEFTGSFTTFMRNPLVIDSSAAPFMSISSEIAKKFASQSLEDVNKKIKEAKEKAQQELMQNYDEFKEEIDKVYGAPSSPMHM